MGFCHLHRHSEYSLLDGIGSAKQYASRAASLGQPALAITDHGNIAGALHHIVACKEAGIKAIVGMEAYFKPDAKVHSRDYKPYHLVLLAKNYEGFRTLMRLTSESFKDENYFDGKPCVDWKMLEEMHEGLIASTSCLSSYMSRCYLAGDSSGAEQYLRRMQRIFKDDLFIELQPHGMPDQITANISLINIGINFGIPLVAAVDAHYPDSDWQDTHDVALLINQGSTKSERERKRELGKDVLEFGGPTYFLMNEDQVRLTFRLYHDYMPADVIESAISNTIMVADMCEPFEVSKAPKIPKVTSSLLEAETIIRSWCEEGLKRIGKEDNEDYRARMEFEIETLREKRVLDYFVIIGDMVRWAKSQGIRVGAGRGSAAGSLVSYLCSITAIDPIAYGLLFERFMNPHRSEMPDVDLDFQHDRRHEVKEYLATKYHVADIAAFQTFGMRSALQSAARVLEVPYEDVMKVTSSLTEEGKLESIREMSEKLDAFAKAYPEVWKHAVRLQGQVKASSKHAAGVIVTDQPVPEYAPTMRSKDGTVVTQWADRPDFPILTNHGFLKIDVLGADGLTMQDRVIRLVRERHGRDIDFEDLNDFPVIADPYKGESDVVSAFGKGMNLGIFQFESSGITQLLKEIKPTWIGDIIAANALYRPGPLEGGVAFDYGARKNGRSEIEYWHPIVEPFLKETYGIMVYQEQVMQIVQHLGGLSLAEADTIRKAMAKLYRGRGGKRPEGVMGEFYDKFIEGCIAHGLTKTQAKDVWQKILTFSGYGFNKSHSAAYSIKAYQDMWLKLRYPPEFYAALLTTEPDKVTQIIREANVIGIRVLPPDINESDEGFTLSDGAIRFGLNAIKGVGLSAIEEIKLKRPFYSYDDFEFRIEKRLVRKNVREYLRDCGAFDSFGLRDGWDEETKAEQEKRLLGYSLSSLDEVTKYSDIIFGLSHDFDSAANRADIMLGGEITKVKEIVTKHGDPMAFVDFVFGTNTYSATFFPNVFSRYQPILREGKAIMVRGDKDEDRGCVLVKYAVLVERLAEEMEKQSAAKAEVSHHGNKHDAVLH